MSATRKNVLAPGSIGVYSGGGNYNPAQMLRDKSIKSATDKIDKKLEAVSDKGVVEIPIADIQELISLTRPDSSQSDYVWNPIAVAESLGKWAKIRGENTGFVFVDRNRDLDAKRRETAGVISGGEKDLVRADKVALFMLRTTAGGGREAAWWPQIRFPDGSYAFAFAI